MNIHRLKKKLRRTGKRLLRGLRRGRGKRRKRNGSAYGGRQGVRISSLRDLRELFDSSRMFYAGYVAVVTVLCILLSQTRPNSQFRKWYFALTNRDTINKGVEMDNEIKSTTEGVGQFLTHYRYHKLGATDPMDVDPDSPMIAFSFDDGPSAEYTQRILEALAANYSHATFFVVGRQTEQFPEKLQDIRSYGCEIGNHTFDHKNLTELSENDILQQIGDVNRSVMNATGEETTVIRPPYGAYDDRVMEYLDKPVILWDVDSEDWKSRNAQTICDKVLSEVKDGDIVLMHDIYGTTADAVELLLPKLKEQGYQIVSVSEMAEYKGKPLELGKAYGNMGE